MGFGIGDIVSIGGALLGGLGGGKEASAASAPQSGFATLPQPVKDAWLKTYLPDVLTQYDKPRQPIPLIRAEAPTTPFDSQELFNFQKFSDLVGGYFSPMGKPLSDVYPTTPPAATQPPAPTPGTVGQQWLTQQAATGNKRAIELLRGGEGNTDLFDQIGQAVNQAGGMTKGTYAVNQAMKELFNQSWM